MYRGNKTPCKIKLIFEPHNLSCKNSLCAFTEVPVLPFPSPTWVLTDRRAEVLLTALFGFEWHRLKSSYVSLIGISVSPVTAPSMRKEERSSFASPTCSRAQGCEGPRRGPLLSCPGMANTRTDQGCSSEIQRWVSWWDRWAGAVQACAEQEAPAVPLSPHPSAQLETSQRSLEQPLDGCYQNKWWRCCCQAVGM